VERSGVQAIDAKDNLQITPALRSSLPSGKRRGRPKKGNM
jgi:hypothetical protein